MYSYDTLSEAVNDLKKEALALILIWKKIAWYATRIHWISKILRSWKYTVLKEIPTRPMKPWSTLSNQ